ncbi:MAG TPA: SdrD B-like domain-containing protein [Gemmataceae bacterium]|nr:SdrD B-like domain-containing protein [Gemmataceae bacterium]
MTKSMNALFRRQPRPADRRVRLSLESLEERCVPSAATVDLTTAGASGAINGALFEQADPQSTGCGVIGDFLRIQAKQGTTEQGYNTDAAPQLDDKGGAFTHSIQLSDIPLVVVNGVAYREFLLGVNQNHSSPLISLDQLKIFLGPVGNLAGYDPTSGTLAGLQAVYDMNAGGASNWVAVNSALSHGNGSGDMYLLVPDQLFAAQDGNPYVYLYSQMGVNYAANGGFEQWAVQRPGAPGSLSGYVYFDENGNGVFDAADSGISGVTVTLSGVTADGQTFSLTTTTDANGYFQFSALPVGTYTLSEMQPAGYTPGAENAGSLGGSTGPSSLSPITGIPLGAGQNGLNYDFGELLQFMGS